MGVSEGIMKNLQIGLSLIFGVTSVSGCGYSLQNSQSQLYLKEGIRKVYVVPLGNLTYKAGVEMMVYNSMVRILAAHKRIILVQSPEDADAILSGTVGVASYVGSASAGVQNLTGVIQGASLPTSTFAVASTYNATLTCSLSLSRAHPKPGSKSQIWAGSFSRSKQFPGSNQVNVPGTTSPLINESEFDRALQDIARGMMEIMHESMLAMF